MKRYALLVILLLSPLMVGWTLNWGPVSSYTDGTLITKTVTYRVYEDNVLISTTGTTSVVLGPQGSGVAHQFGLEAVVDNVSSTRAGYSWTSPFAQPQAPAAISVSP